MNLGVHYVTRSMNTLSNGFKYKEIEYRFWNTLIYIEGGAIKYCKGTDTYYALKYILHFDLLKPNINNQRDRVASYKLDFKSVL